MPDERRWLSSWYSEREAISWSTSIASSSPESACCTASTPTTVASAVSSRTGRDTPTSSPSRTSRTARTSRRRCRSASARTKRTRLRSSSAAPGSPRASTSSTRSRASASTGSPSTTRTPSRGKPLGDLHDSGFIGLTVVAVVRGDSANPAPSPDFVVFPGDTIVVAGAPEKVAKAFSFYRSGELAAASAEAPPGASACTWAVSCSPSVCSSSSPTSSDAWARPSACRRSRSTCSWGSSRARTPRGSG